MDDRERSLADALRAAEELASHAMQLQELTASLSQAKTEDEVADVALGKGVDVLGAARGVLARVDHDRFEMIRAHGYDPQTRARLLALTPGDDPISAAMKAGEPLWLNSPEEHHARFPAIYRNIGISTPATSVAIPLQHGGETVGALVLVFADAHAFGAVRRAFTLLLAQAAAAALARARSYDVERMARHGAELLAQARADVLGIVAHDLRNPLNLISSSSSILVDMDFPAAQRQKTAEIMQRAVRRMNRLIGDLLDATRLQAGRLSLEITAVDAARAIREVEETLRPSATERRITLGCAAPDDECFVRADEGRLLQVLENLAGNAIKFTRPGGAVLLSVKRVDGEAVFSVSDDGPGIPPDHHAHLFDTFWQANQHDRRGVGLGLSITKEIVSALGGRIWVESVVGSGSTFSLTIPLAQTVPAPVSVRGVRESQAARATALA
ncbi:MAG TPA: GAF domain-containing sensor histidine kinase [Gemmatimonadaceae bacterium]|nr:GAF domain-containing sensor histidine kinase [Gemmatimonadaceae bacterium]